MKQFFRLSAFVLVMLLISACGGISGGGGSGGDENVTNPDEINSDTIKPVITLQGDANITLTVGNVYIDAGATATDDVDGNITHKIVVHNPVDTSTIGTYTITYDVNDTAGNAADQVVRTVTVSDMTKPIIR